MKLTCIMCPVGCDLFVDKKDNNIEVTGNRCIRGKRYAETEITHPMRIVTSLAKTKSGKVISVKTSDLVPKEKIFKVLDEIAKIKAKDNIKIGEVLIKNVLGLIGVNIVVTRQ